MLFHGKPKAEGTPAPKSSRIAIAIPVNITGKDATGHSFKETTRTVEIDRQGGRILTLHQLAVGASISIENPSLGQTALAKVVNCINRRSRQGPSQIDIELADLPELFEAASIWGVKGRGEATTPAGDRGAAGLEAAHSAGAPVSVASATADPPKLPEPPAVAVVAVAPAAGPAREPSLAAKQDVVEELQRVRLKMQASFESRAAEQQRQLAEMAASGVREVQRRSDSLVQEFQSRLENALRESQQKGMTEATAELRQLVENSQESTAQHLARQSELAAESLNEQLKKSTTAAAADAEQRLASLSKAAVEALEEQVRAAQGNTQAAVDAVTFQAQAVTEECRSRLMAASEEQTRRVEEGKVAALAAVQAAAADGVSGVERVRQQLEASLEARAAEYQQRLAGLEVVLEGLEERAQNQSLPAAGRNRAAHLAPEDGEQASESLRGVARELLEESKRRMEEQVKAASEQVRSRFRDELKAQASALVEKAGQQLTQRARAAIESGSAAVEAFSEESRGRLARASQEHVRQADESAQALLGSIRQAAEQSQRDFNARQEKAEAAANALNRAAEQAALRLEGAERQAEAAYLEFRKNADAVLERSSQELHQQAQEAAHQLAEEIRVTGAALTGEKQRELAAITQAAAESLAQEAECLGQQSRAELRRVLEEFVARSAEEVRGLDDARLDQRVENARRQRATLERLRLECVRLEHSAGRRIAGLVRDLVVFAAAGMRSNLKRAVKAGVALAAVSAVFVTYFSVRPVTRLRAEPPKEFYDEYLMLDARRRPAEEILARAYWDCARLEIQGKYAYGRDLPEEPPADFGVDESALTRAGIQVDPNSRARYWARLRLVWLLPQAWEQSYGWHTDWIHVPFALRRGIH